MQTGQAPSQLRQPEKSPLPGRERNKCREGEGEGAAERQSELRNTCDGEAKQRSWPISARDWSDANRAGDARRHGTWSEAGWRAGDGRSEERRVGTRSVSKCRIAW